MDYQMIMSILQAMQIESDSGLIGAYIVFLSRHCDSLPLQSMDALALVSYPTLTCFYKDP